MSLLLTKSLYCSGSSKVSSYNLTRSSGEILFSMVIESDDESDETKMVSVVMVVNLEDWDEELGIRDDSVMTSVKLLSMVDFCSAIVSRQRVVIIGFCRLLALVMVVQ